MQIIQHPASLFILFIMGILGQKIPSLPTNTAKRINKFILYVPLPAIVLTKIPFLNFSKEMLFPIASAWITFFGAALFAYLFCKWKKYDRKTMACLILCCGLGNTSFVGFPFLTYFYGAESLKYAILVDQPGSFLLLSTFGVIVATYFSAAALGWKGIIYRLISFPPFLLFILALFIKKEFISGMVYDTLDFIGKFMVPLALFSLGLQFKLNIKEVPWKKLSAGLAYKLFLAPAIIYFLYFILLKQRGELHAVSLIECAMPPMITSSILAADHDLDAALANTLPTLGIIAALPTLFFWKWILDMY